MTQYTNITYTNNGVMDINLFDQEVFQEIKNCTINKKLDPLIIGQLRNKYNFYTYD